MPLRLALFCLLALRVTATENREMRMQEAERKAASLPWFWAAIRSINAINCSSGVS